MALLIFARRLKLQRLSSNLLLAQSLRSAAHQFASPALSTEVICLSRAFHQTALRQCKHSPNSSILLRSHNWRICGITDFEECGKGMDEDVRLEVEGILERVRKARDFSSGDEAMAFLDDSGIKPRGDFIYSLIWSLREEWKLSFLVFKWGEKWDCVVERTWCLMVWLLGNHKKFSTAWTLIHELHLASKDTQQAMLIMIDRYAAADCPGKATETFHLMQKLKFFPEQSPYFTFLDILCRHGYIEEAEEFMYHNKKFFPLETKSFNKILKGWCNIAKDINEAKRVWREMSNCCTEPDGSSYTHMISCYSSGGNLFDSLRLYDQMKKRGWNPGVEVYHSLIYVLAREDCLDEALKIVDRMNEVGIVPNSTTYDLIICTLCEAAKFEEARTILVRMISNDIKPTIDTFHALIVGENLEGMLGVLNHMRNAGLGPNRNTFKLILDRFFTLGQAENALKVWSEMKQYMVEPDKVHYSILVKGLAKCGLIAEARKFHSEMASVGLADDPLIKKLLEEPVQQKDHAGIGKGKMTVVRHIKKGNGLQCQKNRVMRSMNHCKQSE